MALLWQVVCEGILMKEVLFKDRPVGALGNGESLLGAWLQGKHFSRRNPARQLCVLPTARVTSMYVGEMKITSHNIATRANRAAFSV